MKKFIILVVLVAIAVAAYVFLYAEGSTDESDTVAYGASFMCEDGTNFAAEFTDDGGLLVLVDGEVDAVLTSAVSASGMMFEDETSEYHFKGETVVVTNKRTGGTTECTQPFDANNAPVNYGD